VCEVVSFEEKEEKTKILMLNTNLSTFFYIEYLNYFLIPECKRSVRVVEKLKVDIIHKFPFRTYRP
jgi:hypothetical protein